MTLGRRAPAVALAMVFASAAAAACTDIPTADNAVLSLVVENLPAPAAVLRDTLRDETGRATPLRATVYNFKGDVVSGAPLRFRALDRGVTVDSVTGFAVGDSLRQTPARIMISVGTLQVIRTLDVTLRPDTVVAVGGVQTLLYSLTDSTKNISPDLSVKLLHTLTSDSTVRAYIVGFAVVSPEDTLLAALVNEAGKSSRTDTTDAGGLASRRIRLNPARLTSLSDSIIVNATVKYRGTNVRGSPVRLVLKVMPGPS